MNHDELQSRLLALTRDPVAAMQRLPEKRDKHGQVLSAVDTPFDSESIKDRRYVKYKDMYREMLMSPRGAGTSLGMGLSDVIAADAPTPSSDDRQTKENDITFTLGSTAFTAAAPLPNDVPGNLVDELRYLRPEEIDDAGLRQASLNETPWSDDYWAMYRGELGYRYADPQFPQDYDWERNINYVRGRPAGAIVADGDEVAINQLSPSEKYDLLVGDADGTLTGSMWAEGKTFYDKTGTVESWMGICHGWAPAAYQLPRPRHVVTTVAEGGRQLRFYPSDIKALASLLWANARTPTRFVGSRENVQEPSLDEVGRLMSTSAFDTNPGTWHLSIVNQLAGGRSFVMDATYDYAVWNQPVFSYEYTYFNPQENRPAVNLRDATVSLGSYTDDRFRKYRNPRARAVVGVAMTVRYVVETSPSHKPADDASDDAITTVVYLYDLELDGEGTIIGGEWWQNAHPDFLWTPPRAAQARTAEDQYATGSWIPPEPVPEQWRQLAWHASGHRMPMARIVEGLIQAANT